MAFIAWEIPDALVNRGGAYGTRLIPHFQRHPLEPFGRHASFEARFRAIISSLKKSKTDLVKNILNPQGHIDRLVEAPENAFKAKESNKKVNAQRDRQNKLGRTAMNRGVIDAEKLGELLPGEDKSATPDEQKNILDPQGHIDRLVEAPENAFKASGIPSQSTVVPATLLIPAIEPSYAILRPSFFSAKYSQSGIFLFRSKLQGIRSLQSSAHSSGSTMSTDSLEQQTNSTSPTLPFPSTPKWSHGYSPIRNGVELLHRTG
ncbi:hypothetical protein HYFRA_00009504 [Hymenoscyphus fraxineus]|uniref:Uncharacterized protein n=1 Tax=Hymenoscyphus fraxineus TaxID=746836 RepID=A0A9N9PTT8_9HELO|nr:hypothetical protein HYFRA_00009504 [Hymenoscyphus fraxineus]